MTRHIILLLSIELTLAGCGGGSSPSSPSGPTGPAGGSHNAGQNCMQCHQPGGGAPTWTVAGTVYQADGTAPFRGATVRLTSGADGTGTVILSVLTDASGNFFTAQALSFDTGLFTDVSGTGATRRAMSSPVSSGACNSCHDASNRIRAD